MATVLLTWELGGGAGHATTLLPLVKAFRERGHRVFVAVQDLARVAKLCTALDVHFLQAPIHARRVSNPIEPLRTLPHILHNVGFGDVDLLRIMTRAWQSLIDCVQPDLCCFNHSPTAMLAARSGRAKRAIFGTGFLCPANCHPLPDLRPWLGDAALRLRQDEDRVLAKVNQVLTESGQTPLSHLAQLYQEVDEIFLTTFPELDPYARQEGTLYWGAWPSLGDKNPEWPDGSGRRVFAYLKPFPALPALLALLNELRCPTLIHGDGLPADLQEKFQSATLRFENDPLDLRQVGKQCDLAILNGTHGTTASMLLAGKPVLQIPLYLEQALNSTAMARTGAGLVALPTSPDQVSGQLRALLSSPRYATAAECFARKYAHLSAKQQIERMIGHALALLN